MANTIDLDTCGLMVDPSVDLDSLRRGCSCKQPIRVGWGTDVSYNDLRDKPTLNGVTIQGAKTASDYGLANKTDIMPTVNAEFEDVETVPERFNLPMMKDKINEVLGILKGTAAVAIAAVASEWMPMNAQAAGVYTTVVSNLWNDSVVVTNVDVGGLGYITDVRTNGVSVLSGSVAELNGLATEKWVEDKNYVTEAVTNGLATTNYVNDLVAKSTPGDYYNVSNKAYAAMSLLGGGTNLWNTVTNKQDIISDYTTTNAAYSIVSNVVPILYFSELPKARTVEIGSICQETTQGKFYKCVEDLVTIYEVNYALISNSVAYVDELTSTYQPLYADTGLTYPAFFSNGSKPLQIMKVNDTYFRITDTDTTKTLQLSSFISEIYEIGNVWYRLTIDDLSGYQPLSQRTDSWSGSGSSSRYPTTKAVSDYVDDWSVEATNGFIKVDVVTNAVCDATNALSKVVVNYDFDNQTNRTAVTIGSRYSSALNQIGTYSFVNGDFCSAKGKYSHAEGESSIAYGDYSHAEGEITQASGKYSNALGTKAISGQDYAYTWNGDTSYSPNYRSHGIGTYNINPVGGVSGFYIGDQNFADHLSIAVSSPAVTNAGAVAYVDAATNGIHSGYITDGTNTVYANLSATIEFEKCGFKLGTWKNQFYTTDEYLEESTAGYDEWFKVGGGLLLAVWLKKDLTVVSFEGMLPNGVPYINVRSEFAGFDKEYVFDVYDYYGETNVNVVVSYNPECRVEETRLALTNDIPPDVSATVSALVAATNDLASGVSGLTSKTSTWNTVTNKQDKLPYLTNAIPWSAISGREAVAEMTKDRYDKYTAFTVGSRKQSSVVGAKSLSVGSLNTASGDNSMTAGYGNKAVEELGIAIGYESNATNKRTFVWNGEITDGYYSHGDGTFNIGVENGLDDIYVGNQSLDTRLTNRIVSVVGEGFVPFDSNHSITLGNRDTSESIGGYSLAIGTDAVASGEYSFSLGYGCYAQGMGSIALGKFAQTLFDIDGIYSFVWNGNYLTPPSRPYVSKAIGSFCINPIGGTDGFYVGENNLTTLLEDSGKKLNGIVYDFQSGTNFTQRLYEVLTNVIDRMGGSITNAPSFN